MDLYTEMSFVTVRCVNRFFFSCVLQDDYVLCEIPIKTSNSSTRGMQGFLLGHHTAGSTTAKQTARGKLLWDWHLAVQENEQLCLLFQNPVFLRDCLLAFLAPGGGSLYRRGGAAYCVLQPLEMGLMCVAATLLWSFPKGEEIFPFQVEQHGAKGWSNSLWSRLSAGLWP